MQEGIAMRASAAAVRKLFETADSMGMGAPKRVVVTLRNGYADTVRATATARYVVVVSGDASFSEADNG